MTVFAGMSAAYLWQQNSQMCRLVVTQGQHFRDECGPASTISRGANSSVPQHGEALLQGPILLASSGGLVNGTTVNGSCHLAGPGTTSCRAASLARPAEM